MQRTMNRRVGYGRDLPVALLPVLAGLVDLCSGRWARGGQLDEGDDTGLGGDRLRRGSGIRLGETTHFQAHVVDGGLNPRCHTHLSTKWNAYPYVRPEINHT
jgi:hypothetical protein